MKGDVLTTREAAELLSVGTSTLKRWVDEGKVLAFRTAGGHRRFSRQGVERIVAAREPWRTLSAEASVEGGAALWADRMLRARDPMPVLAEILRARARLGSYAAVADELGRALEVIGRRWATKDISILDEHVASELLERATHLCVEGIPLRPGAPVCLLASAEGDEHTLGLSLAELCCRESGFASRWVGRRTPTGEIVEAVAREGLRAVALSASIYSDDPRPLEEMVEAVAVSARQAGTELVLGGRGAWPVNPSYGVRIDSFERFARHLGSLVR